MSERFTVVDSGAANMEEKHTFPPSTSICLFQQSEPKQQIKAKRRRGAQCLWPSPHTRVLPRFLPWVQLNVIFHAPSSVDPHCHKDAEDDEDYTTGTSNCKRQDADLGERN